MAEYDLVIRNGTVVDGTGLVPERAEVCVDKDYVLAGVGLLADENPKAAEGLAAHIHGTDATGH